jgi:acetyl esterase/lipase
MPVVATPASEAPASEAPASEAPASATPVGAPGPPPPFDPELAAFAREFRATWPSVTPAMIPLLRQPAALPRPSDTELARGGAFTVETRAVPGPAGAPDLPLLICLPAGAAGPTPLLYHLHGGGLFAGEARFDIGAFLTLAAGFPLAVIGADYRLAPETPHPGPVEDCYAGLVWIDRHAAELNIDRSRIIVEGSSGGAALAAGVGLLARDRGGPAILGQMLLAPMLDDRNDSPAVAQLAGVALWDGITNATAWDALLGDHRGGSAVSPYAAPARAEDLSGSPATFIDVGSVEIFRDEAVDYATQLWHAGIAAELHVWAGGFHGFEQALPHAALSQDAMAARGAWLRRLLRDR